MIGKKAEMQTDSKEGRKKGQTSRRTDRQTDRSVTVYTALHGG